MLTLFAIPKAFKGHNAVIQRNAVMSWLRLEPRCEIILLGDDTGTAEIAQEFSLRHIPHIRRNEYGTPLISDMFEQAQRAASYRIMCYVNADIMLMMDFMRAAEQTARHKRHFLMVGQRCDIDIKQPWDFQQPDWSIRLRQLAQQQGHLYGEAGMDYFVFPKGLFGPIPAFAIGRTVWDNWFLYRARQRNAALVDATQAVLAVHQNHDYSHISSQSGDPWKGLEAQNNLRLAGGYEHAFLLPDATCEITANGSQLQFRRRLTRRHWNTLPVVYPYLRCLFRVGGQSRRMIQRILKKMSRLFIPKGHHKTERPS